MIPREHMLKVMRLESFINTCPMLVKLNGRRYKAAIGNILVLYSKMNDELCKEFPDFRSYCNMLYDALEIIEHLPIIRERDDLDQKHNN